MFCVGLVASRKKAFLHPLLFALFQLLNVMTEFERRAQLQSHVLHNDITAQQHQSSAVDLMFSEQFDMRAESLGVSLLDKPHDIVN